MIDITQHLCVDTDVRELYNTNMMKTLLNQRQIDLKSRIERGETPHVIDASVIYYPNECDIPFHWGDIEALGFGYTTRQYYDNEKELYRHYTGPGSIFIVSWDEVMKAGSVIGGAC